MASRFTFTSRFHLASPNAQKGERTGLIKLVLPLRRHGDHGEWLLKACEIPRHCLVSKSLQEVVLSPQAATGPTAGAVHEAVAGELNEVRLAERAHGGAGTVRLEA